MGLFGPSKKELKKEIERLQGLLLPEHQQIEELNQCINALTIKKSELDKELEDRNQKIQTCNNKIAELEFEISDKQKQIYITDKGNNRIIILNSDFTLKTVIKEFTAANTVGSETVTDTFNAPSSVYVTNAGHLYVADTDNNRIVEFDENSSFVRQIGCPDSKILGDNYVFSPTSIAADSSERIYVMIKNENQGIVELNPDGTFIGYYGAQKVQQTLFDWFKTLFMTKEQKSRIAKTIPRTQQYGNR